MLTGKRKVVFHAERGDRNTSYFYHKASKKKKKNTIDFLFNELGQRNDDDHEVENIAVSYFR